MSVRNMLKVVMSLLLAMTIAATADTHAARVDQPPAPVAGKLNDWIPYLLCQRICIGACICDKRPPEFAECICSKPGDPNKPAALLHTSEETLQMKGKSENSGLIPYVVCKKTCSKCACTKMWPPEINMCSCLEDDSVPNKATAIADRLDQSLASITEKAHELYEKLALLAGPVQKGTSGDGKKMVVWNKGKMEAVPYEECIKTCEKCACTLPWPPEASICICVTSKLDLLTGPVKKGTSGDDKKMAVWTKAKMEAIPYEECIKTCEKCACTLPWPPEASICICVTSKLDLLAGPVQKGTSGDGKKMVVWTEAKMEAIPYEECIKTCEKCACTLPWPPEASICICVTSKLDLLARPVQKGTSGDNKKMVVWTKAKMEAIPYEECIKTCEKCACTLPWPPEASICICITSKPPAAGGKALAM